jgi:twinkle protein
MHISEKQILEQCANHGIPTHETKTTREHVIIKECPFCEKPTGGRADNQYKLYVSLGGGAYFCHRCGAKGSWYDFKMKLGGFEVVGIDGQSQGAAKATSSNQAWTNTSTTAPLPMPSERLQACYISSLLDLPETNQVLDYLINVRGLQKTTLRKYGVGRATYNFPSKEPNSPNQYVAAECVTFPWIMRASEVKEQEALRGVGWKQETEDKYITRRIKARALQSKAWQRLDPPGGGWGLFGFHTVPEDATELVITEGEYDAMAVYQGTGRPTVSLPNGCRSLPVEVLPLLERFHKIYLWMDNDGPGQEGAEKFAKKIGQNRCFLVRPDSAMQDMPKDANDALLMGLDMNEMLDKASLIPHERIMQFGELRDDVLHEIMYPDKYVGVPVPSLPLFTGLVKGFRRGEVTVVTGPTGSGKVRVGF